MYSLYLKFKACGFTKRIKIYNFQLKEKESAGIEAVIHYDVIPCYLSSPKEGWVSATTLSSPSGLLQNPYFKRYMTLNTRIASDHSPLL